MPCAIIGASEVNKMAIINDFDDLRFVIRDLSEETIRRMVADREFAVIKVAP